MIIIYILNILIPFDLIIDTDMGILKLLRFDYRNDNYFYPGIVLGSDECLQYALIKRQDPNPISIAYKYAEEDHDTMDGYYSQFMEKEYDKILSLSCCTSISDLTKLASYNKDKIVRITIRCNNEKEKELVLARKISPHAVIVAKPEEVDLSVYNCLYVKNIKDLDNYKKVEGLNIFIANYGFNVIIDEHYPDPILPVELVTKYASDNEIRLFTVYALDPRKIPID